MKYLFNFFACLCFSFQVSAQGHHLSTVTDVFVVEDASLIIGVSLFDNMTTPQATDDTVMAFGCVHVAASALPEGSEKSSARFRTSVPRVVKISHTEHMYYVYVAYDNNTPDPTDDIVVGHATFSLDATRSGEIAAYLGLEILERVEAFSGKPAFETHEVQVIPTD